VYKPSRAMPSSTETRFAVAEIHRLTGKRYPKLEALFETLDGEGRQELVRFCRDLDGSVRQAERKAILQPWRR
jgi:hypothetical protein